jgi:hypothetical protein
LTSCVAGLLGLVVGVWVGTRWAGAPAPSREAPGQPSVDTIQPDSAGQPAPQRGRRGRGAEANRSQALTLSAAEALLATALTEPDYGRRSALLRQIASTVEVASLAGALALVERIPAGRLRDEFIQTLLAPGRKRIPKPLWPRFRVCPPPGVVMANW